MKEQSQRTDARTLIVDLDGTLCSQEKSDEYHLAKPQMEVIRKVNALWTDGWNVVIFTARGMKTFSGDVAKCENAHRANTERWLRDNRVCYDRLMFGKPSGDLYVDDKGMNPHEFARCSI